MKKEEQDKVCPYSKESHNYDRYFTKNPEVIKKIDKAKLYHNLAIYTAISSGVFVFLTFVFALNSIVVPAFVFFVLSIMIVFVSLYLSSKSEKIHYDAIEDFELSLEYKRQKGTLKEKEFKTKDEELTAKATQMVELFATLSDKRTNKKSRINKVKKIIDEEK